MSSTDGKGQKPGESSSARKSPLTLVSGAHRTLEDLKRVFCAISTFSLWFGSAIFYFDGRQGSPIMPGTKQSESLVNPFIVDCTIAANAFRVLLVEISRLNTVVAIGSSSA